ncbi:MAG: polysaccharide deacetylase family protein [Chlorobi bacterium]|nr:polysaccharide deacetylase family protein [Chlorobiota bacterium]
MRLTPYRFPRLLEPLFRPALIRVPSSNAVFLTFDDGPTPRITDRVLEILDAYGAKATFFLIGDKAARHPETVFRLIREGHLTGNHTWHHVTPGRVGREKYLEEIARMQAWMEKHRLPGSRLFRPPHGRIPPSLIRLLDRRGIRTVLWTRLSMDFNPRIDPETSLRILTKHLRPGDIVVFHDSEKARSSLTRILPPLLEHIRKQGWKTEVLPRA